MILVTLGTLHFPFDRLLGALGRCEITGVATNVAMQRALLATAEFRQGGVDTSYLERHVAAAAPDGSRA